MHDGVVEEGRTEGIPRTRRKYEAAATAPRAASHGNPTLRFYGRRHGSVRPRAGLRRTAVDGGRAQHALGRSRRTPPVPFRRRGIFRPVF